VALLLTVHSTQRAWEVRKKEWVREKKKEDGVAEETDVGALVNMKMPFPFRQKFIPQNCHMRNQLKKCPHIRDTKRQVSKGYHFGVK